MAEGRTCPDCGRPIASNVAQLCPACGYPLIFDGAPPQPTGVLRKPESAPRTVDSRTGSLRQAHVEPPRQQTLGPHCPSCHHRNPPRRVRCEMCAAELWPGAASPSRRAPVVAARAVAPPRRGWVVPLVTVLAVLAAMVLLYLLAYRLA